MPFIEEKNNKTVPLWINGKSYVPEKAATFTIISSGTKDAVHSAISAGIEEAVLACDTANAVFKQWRKTTYVHRRNLLLKAADIYSQRIDEIASHQVNETSCPPPFAKWNIMKAVGYIQEIACSSTEVRGAIAQRPGAADGTEEDGLTLVVTEPVGPVLIIPPWNGAVILPTRAISMAIAAGCTLVVKASEKCPMTHHMLVQAFEAAGVPPGVINMIQTERSSAAAVTEALVSHPAIRKVDFIGSQAVGRQIGALCGKYLKPILMELGGKGPAIVLDDANLEKAAKLCAMGAILHHGQLCFSTERIIVQRAISDKFIPLLKSAMEHIPTAGIAVDDASAKHAFEVLIDAQNNGATFLIGGPKYLKTNSLAPTLVMGLTSKARIWDEETFGPSATVYVVDTDEEAIERANDSAYGLNAAVHSTNWERAYNVAKQLEYGQVVVNSMTVADNPTQPIRGVKGSGWGQSNAIWGIKEFTIEKTINMGPTRGGASFM